MVGILFVDCKDVDICVATNVMIIYIYIQNMWLVYIGVIFRNIVLELFGWSKKCSSWVFFLRFCKLVIVALEAAAA